MGKKIRGMMIRENDIKMNDQEIAIVENSKRMNCENSKNLKSRLFYNFSELASDMALSL